MTEDSGSKKENLYDEARKFVRSFDELTQHLEIAFSGKTPDLVLPGVPAEGDESKFDSFAIAGSLIVGLSILNDDKVLTFTSTKDKIDGVILEGSKTGMKITLYFGLTGYSVEVEKKNFKLLRRFISEIYDWQKPGP